MKNLGKLGKQLGKVSVESLPKSDFDFVFETLEDYPDVAAKYDNPLLAMFHIYKGQVRRGKVNDKLEGVIMAAAEFKNPKAVDKSGKAGRETSSRHPAESLGSRQSPSEHIVRGGQSRESLSLLALLEARPGLGKKVESEVECAAKAVMQLTQFEERNRQKLGTISPELAEAHREEIEYLNSTVIQTRLKRALGQENPEVAEQQVRFQLGEIAIIADRLREGQEWRLKHSKHGIGEDRTVTPNLGFVKNFVTEERAKAALGGLQISVPNPTSPDLARAYSRFALYFPTDEIDGSAMMMDYLRATSNGRVINGKRWDPVKSELVSEKQYVKFIVMFIRDEQGEIIGGVAGAFCAGEKTNKLYLSHIVISEERRRSYLATLVAAAVLTECQSCIADAERQLGVRYQSDPTGNKLVSVDCEIEPPDPSNPEVARETFRRLRFFATRGMLVLPSKGFPYLQSDPNASGKRYDPDEYSARPLLFGMLPIGLYSVVNSAQLPLILKADAGAAEQLRANLKSDPNAAGYLAEFLGVDAPSLLKIAADPKALSEAFGRALYNQAIQSALLTYGSFIDMGMNRKGVQADIRFLVENLEPGTVPQPIPGTAHRFVDFVMRFELRAVLQAAYGSTAWAKTYFAGPQTKPITKEDVERILRGEPPAHM